MAGQSDISRLVFTSTTARPAPVPKLPQLHLGGQFHAAHPEVHKAVEKFNQELEQWRVKLNIKLDGNTG